jgi:hypothetical protein
MEKSSGSPCSEVLERADPAVKNDRKSSQVMVDIDTEHQLTFRDVWKNHKPIIGWSFFWAMCAVGW